MNREGMKKFTLREYKGCGIQPASLSRGPNDWLPEACFWLHTDTGWRRLWVASFTHCLPGAEMTFPSQIDADGWAFHLARQLIDKILPDLATSVRTDNNGQKNYAAKLIGLVLEPLLAIHAVKRYRSRT